MTIRTQPMTSVDETKYDKIRHKTRQDIMYHDMTIRTQPRTYVDETQYDKIRHI